MPRILEATNEQTRITTNDYLDSYSYNIVYRETEMDRNSFTPYCTITTSAVSEGTRLSIDNITIPSYNTIPSYYITTATSGSLEAPRLSENCDTFISSILNDNFIRSVRQNWRLNIHSEQYKKKRKKYYNKI